mmetsp:Transcript_7854/g.11535  ORF Transcript_7854/g.11535 Transcript_7854/m.11535 type:complete len:205 (+) Transcript_7854:92-706(+)|eukprot:CAMPEP_0197247000 /NCGR_PEP_ID=MMETSP1429-20130617/25258_1 /TAXON_ID=49237 /ORGANISM="Chaetoceros  sp., Strain UNC1202" /LENGTH=204 /DNA_ID=CAMNT_0042707803 /DNA_START=65 /DNA_END=679 /DNA_ORIENTATION=+
MNAFRHKLSAHFLQHKKGGILKSVALSTALTSVTTTIAFCESNDDNGNGNGNEPKDILSKIKSTLSSTMDTKNLNLNTSFDDLAQTLGNQIQSTIETGIPTQISYGFICGFSSGYALKKAGRVASIVFGMGFITLQSLAYAGYIEVDHGKVKKDVEHLMDLNNDGRIDGKDVDQVVHKIREVLEFNMTGGTGFAAGFFGGLRSG